MRLPSARTAVGIYVAVLALATIPQLTTKVYASSWWTSVPWSLLLTLVPAALFVAAFAMDDRWAFALPVVALTGQTLLVHQFGVKSEYSEGLGQVLLRHELWEMIKFQLPVALIVVGAAFWIGQIWEPWVSEDRIDPPPLTWPAIVLGVSLALSFVLHLVLQHFESLHGVLMALALGVIGAATIISFFVLCAAGYSPWVLPLPIFLTVETAAEVLSVSGFSCNDSYCHEFLWPALRTTLIVWTGVMLTAFAAGWWARRESDHSPVQISSFEPSITARSPGSEK